MILLKQALIALALCFANTQARAQSQTADPLTGSFVQGQQAAKDAFVRIADNAAESVKNKQQVDENRFTTGRGLNEYTSGLHPSFEGFLNNLGPGHIWIDVGAGEAKAAIQYLEVGGRASVVAISVERPSGIESKLGDSLLKYRGRFRYFAKRYIEDYSSAELPSADLITDFYGAFAYTEHLDRVVKKFGQMLKTGGRAYIHYPMVLTRVVDKNGGILSLDGWLLSIRGFRMFRNDSCTQIVLIRTADILSVPPLTLTKIRSDAPPYREYRCDRISRN